MMTNASDADVEDGGTLYYDWIINTWPYWPIIGSDSEVIEMYPQLGISWDYNSLSDIEVYPGKSRITLSGNYFFRSSVSDMPYNAVGDIWGERRREFLQQNGPGQLYTSRFSDFGFRARFKNYYNGSVGMTEWYWQEEMEPLPKELFCPYFGYVINDPDPERSCLRRCEDYDVVNYPNGPCDLPRKGNCYYKCTDIEQCQKNLLGVAQDDSDNGYFFHSNRMIYGEDYGYSSTLHAYEEPHMDPQNLFEPEKTDEKYLRNVTTFVDGVTKVECAAYATNEGNYPGPGGNWDLRNFNSAQQAEESGWFYWRPYVYGSCCTTFKERDDWASPWYTTGSECKNGSDYECHLTSKNDIAGEGDELYKSETFFRSGSTCEEVGCPNQVCLKTGGQYPSVSCAGELLPVGACCGTTCVDNVVEEWCENWDDTGGLVEPTWHEDETCKEACPYGACCDIEHILGTWTYCWGPEEFIINGGYVGNWPWSCRDSQTEKGCEAGFAALDGTQHPNRGPGTWAGDHTTCLDVNMNPFPPFECSETPGECRETTCICYMYPDSGGPGAGCEPWQNPCDDACWVIYEQEIHSSVCDADYPEWWIKNHAGWGCDVNTDIWNFIQQFGFVQCDTMDKMDLCENCNNSCYQYCRTLVNNPYQGDPDPPCGW